VVRFADDLQQNLARADASYFAMLDAMDAHVRRYGLSLEEEPNARELGEDPDCVVHPLKELDLAASGVTSIVWATGYQFDFDWLRVDAFDEAGKPKHRLGVSSEPGVYFLGLPWMMSHGSAFIVGVWRDAIYIADHLANQQRYIRYPTDGR
jgi:putative flavoprotein involved in K+ transport